MNPCRKRSCGGGRGAPAPLNRATDTPAPGPPERPASGDGDLHRALPPPSRTRPWARAGGCARDLYTALALPCGGPLNAPPSPPAATRPPRRGRARSAQSRRRPPRSPAPGRSSRSGLAGRSTPKRRAPRAPRRFREGGRKRRQVVKARGRRQGNTHLIRAQRAPLLLRRLAARPGAAWAGAGVLPEANEEVGKSEVAEAGVHHGRAGGAAPPRLEARQLARRGLAAGRHGHRRHARDQHPGAAARDVAVGVVAEPLLARPEDVAGPCAGEGRRRLEPAGEAAGLETGGGLESEMRGQGSAQGLGLVCLVGVTVSSPLYLPNGLTARHLEGPPAASRPRRPLGGAALAALAALAAGATRAGASRNRASGARRSAAAGRRPSRRRGARAAPPSTCAPVV